MRRLTALILITALAAMLLAGCSQEQQTEAEETMEGTLEQAGEALDEAGEAIDEAVDEVGEAVDEAVDEVGDAIDDAK